MKTLFFLLLILGVLGFHACSSSTNKIDDACIIKGTTNGITSKIICYNGKGVAFTPDGCKAMANSFYNAVEMLSVMGVIKAPDSISSSVATSCPDNAARSCHLNISSKLDTVAMYDTTYQYMCGIATAK